MAACLTALIGAYYPGDNRLRNWQFIANFADVFFIVWCLGSSPLSPPSPPLPLLPGGKHRPSFVSSLSPAISSRKSGLEPEFHGGGRLIRISGNSLLLLLLLLRRRRRHPAEQIQINLIEPNLQYANDDDHQGLPQLLERPPQPPRGLGHAHSPPPPLINR